MRKKQIIILIVVLAVLIAAALGLKLYNTSRENKEAEEEEAATVYITSFDTSDVVALSYTIDDELLSFTYADEAWTYDDDTSIDIDEDEITDVLEDLCSITAQEVLEDVDDLSEYGFDEPTKTCTVTLSDGTVIELTFGMLNDILGYYYMQLSGDDNVYLVNASLVTTTLISTVDDLTVEEEEEEEEEEDTSDEDASSEDSSDEEDTSDDSSEETSDEDSSSDETEETADEDSSSDDTEETSDEDTADADEDADTEDEE